MKKHITFLLILISILSFVYAAEVSLTAEVVSSDATTITYSAILSESNVDVMNFDIHYDPSSLQLTSITAGSQIATFGQSAFMGNVGAGSVIIDLPGFDGEIISGEIAIISFTILNSNNNDIGFLNTAIASGDTSEEAVEDIAEDKLEEAEPESEEGRKFNYTKSIPDDNTNQNQQQNQQTPSNNNQQTPPSSNNNNNDEEPEDDNSILIYSLIAVGALILIVGGFVAWNKFKKPKDELPIHETTPLQQPDQPQPTQPAPQQPTQPQTPPTDQQPDQPTQ